MTLQRVSASPKSSKLSRRGLAAQDQRKNTGSSIATLVRILTEGTLQDKAQWLLSDLP
jgi:hypothetical protein